MEPWAGEGHSLPAPLSPVCLVCFCPLQSQSQWSPAVPRRSSLRFLHCRDSWTHRRPNISAAEDQPLLLSRSTDTQAQMLESNNRPLETHRIRTALRGRRVPTLRQQWKDLYLKRTRRPPEAGAEHGLYRSTRDPRHHLRLTWTVSLHWGTISSIFLFSGSDLLWSC